MQLSDDYGFGWASKKSRTAAGNASEMVGAWPPPGIVQSSTAPPGRQPVQRVTVASAVAPSTVTCESTSICSSTSDDVAQPSYFGPCGDGGLRARVRRHRAARTQVDRPALEQDRVVSRAVDLEDGDGTRRGAIGGLHEGRAGQAHDRRDVSAWAHASAYDMNPPFEWPMTSIRLGSTENFAFDLGDDACEVGRVVDASLLEVAARVGRIPEPAPVVVQRPIRVDVQVTAPRGLVPQTEVRLVIEAGGAVAMEEDEEWGRMGGVVARRDLDRDGPVAADDDLGGKG